MPPLVRRTPELGWPDAGVPDDGPLEGTVPDEGGRRLDGTLGGESLSPRTEMGTASKPRAITPENDVDVGGWLSGPVRGSSTPGSLRRGPRSGGLCGLLTAAIFGQHGTKVHEEAKGSSREGGHSRWQVMPGAQGCHVLGGDKPRRRARHHLLDLPVESAEMNAPMMEYLDGQDLAATLKARRLLPFEEAVELVLQACEAIGEAHAAGIVHRDR